MTLLGSGISDDIGKDGRVEELHRQLRPEVLVAEVGRVVGLHEVDVLLVPVGPVDPEPLAAKTFRRTGLILLTLGKVVNNYPNFLYWYVFNLCFTCKIQYAYKCIKK